MQQNININADDDKFIRASQLQLAIEYNTQATQRSCMYFVNVKEFTQPTNKKWR